MTTVKANSKSSWLACIYLVADKCFMGEEQEDDFNTAMAWIAEELDVDLMTFLQDEFHLYEKIMDTDGVDRINKRADAIIALRDKKRDALAKSLTGGDGNETW